MSKTRKSVGSSKSVKSEVKHTAIPVLEKKKGSAELAKAGDAVKLGTAPTATQTPGAAVTKPVMAEVKVSEMKVAEMEKGTAPAALAAIVKQEVKTVDDVKTRELLAALVDPSAETARDAAEDLGALGDVSAVEPLIGVIRNEDGYFHGVVRMAAAQSLGRLKDGRAVLSLCEMTADPMAEASAEAVRALAQIGDVKAVGTLSEILENANGYYLSVVRLAAVHALAALGGPAASAALAATAARAYEDEVIRSAARTAL